MEKTTAQQHTALLVMDIQGPTMKMIKEPALITAALNKAIQHARKSNMPVIYVVIGFRKGFPDASPAHKTPAGMQRLMAMGLDQDDAYRVHPAVNPQPDDIIVLKKRVSAFSGSDLEVVLRSLGIKHLVLTGIATSGVVLSTLREAADKDYQLTVLTDCCADMDEEVHRVLTTKIFVRQATVAAVEEWTAATLQNT